MKEYLSLMARYNQWQNAKMFKLCLKIPDEDRKKDMDAFFKSVHGTLNHILLGDRAWLARLKESPVKVNYAAGLIYPDFMEFTTQRDAADRELIDFVASQTEETLKNDFIYTSAVDNITRTLPLWACIAHIFNHQTHHRGQVSTLMKQFGVDPGIMDLPWTPGLAKEQRPDGSKDI